MGIIPKTIVKASEYDGRSPITIARQSTTFEETSITTSVTKAITETKSAVNDTEFNISAGVSYGPFSVDSNLRVQSTFTDTVVSSLTETISNVNKVSSGESYVTTVFIGNNGEPAGRYRVSLFATADVYLTLHLNEDNSAEVAEHEISVIPRPDSLTYKIDYDPNLNGGFKRNGGSETLPIPDDFTSLHFPTTVTRFAAIGSNVIWYSDDGIEWKQVNPNPGITGSSVVAYDNKFVLAAENKAMYTSVDAVTWEKTASNSPQKFNGISYNKGTWIAACDNGYLAYLIGAASNWSQISGPTFNFSMTNYSGSNSLVPVWNDVAYGNGVWVVVGGVSYEYRGEYAQNSYRDYTYNFANIAYSTNGGSAWSQISPVRNTTEGDPIRWKGIAYGNSMFVTVGGSGMAYSTNGTSWTNVGSGSWNSVKYRDGLFVAVGNAVQGNGRIAYSTNGINWSEVNVGTSGWQDIAYGNGKWIAVGGESNTARVAYSDNGMNWTVQSVNGSTGIWSKITFGKFNAE